MNPEVYAEIRAADPDVTPDLVQGMWRLLAPIHHELGYQAPRVERDLRYGPDSRHRLDVHHRADGGAPAPVLLFVHGGGFVGGDKHTPGMPYYDNVAGWGVRHGLVGVNMTYRLAPEHRWPAGADDVAAALAWVREHVGAYGGDPGRVVLAGHSAGAVHVASFLARAGADLDGVAGAMLLSGIYDLRTAARNEPLRAYFGADPLAEPAADPLPGLLECPVPLLFSVAEFDPADFHRQVAGLFTAWYERHGRTPRLAWVADHNHISEIASLGLDDDALGTALRQFASACTGARMTAEKG